MIPGGIQGRWQVLTPCHRPDATPVDDNHGRTYGGRTSPRQ